MFFNREKFADDCMVPVLKSVYQGLVFLIPLGCKVSYPDEGVGASADCRDDQNGPVPFNGLGYDVHHLGHCI